MNFVNREKEMETLNREYKKENSFVVIYGRRRVGKTTLIKEFIKDKKAFYFFADKQNENLQIERFKNQIAENFSFEIFIIKYSKSVSQSFISIFFKISSLKFSAIWFLNLSICKFSFCLSAKK